MNLDKIDLFVSDKPVAHEVTIGDEPVTIYIRELPESDAQPIFMLWTEKDAAKRAEMRAKLILASVCDEKGKPLFTAAQCGQMRPKIAGVFERAILEVNGIVEKAKDEAAKK